MITVVSGETNNTVDAGILRPASLGDFVWEDKNGNGIQDAGEPGIAGVVVMLEDGSGNPATDINGNVVASVVTNASGQYGFTNLKPGVGYVVKFTKPAGYEATAKDQGGDDTKDSDADVVTGKAPVVVLQSGENNPTIDAGYYRPATIGDFVWQDINANGIQDPGESGVAGVTVNLTGTTGAGVPVNLTTTTNGSGIYTFNNLAPGTYTVTVVKPGGFLFSPQNAGGDDNVDSDADPVTGVMAPVVLQSGEVNLSLDAGIYPKINLEIDKDFVSAVMLPNGTFNVTYTIQVQNTGGPGTYNLSDIPAFDNDVTINSASYTSNAPGNLNGNLAGSGPWTLASNQAIAALVTHTYTLLVNVSLNLSDNTGNNVYTACGSTGQNPLPGQGLFNKAVVNSNDNTPDKESVACGDLPYVDMIKDFVSVTQNANGTFTVNYKITVQNKGGAAGTYTLKDTPQFDDDVTIISGNYSGQANGIMNTSGSTTLASGANINPGQTHIYNVSFVVSLDLSQGSGGNNVYTACSVPGNGPGSNPGQGLYNKAELDRGSDGTFEVTDDACGDLPYVDMRKDFVNVITNPNGTYTVNYAVIVNNTGGATGTYSLKDTPLFDDDVTILSGSYWWSG
ncbi:MAG: carboxypeptidase regulatory-like domain-containing protein [Saprospiraceae bacterium]|nr:carboxypeptidase regulatory-like domain-containing protein [Saprospiraceae bacterium]